MALDNYSNLQTSIANFLARDDLTTEIVDFIALTEADFNRRLRIRAMENSSSFTIDSETETLPTGFLQARSFVIPTNPKTALQFMTPFHQAETQGSSETGKPRAYSIEGTNFRFSPTPDASYSATLVFYKAFDALSASVATNHILTNHPDVYLFGALYFASTFIRGMDPQTVGQFKTQYETALQQVEMADEKDKYNATPLVQRTGININNFDNI
tara:strand:+ start:466 stop:1107 length:642 start_codon:yes stop_codon:yes gene_type:complete